MSEQIPEVPDLFRLAYMPGVFRCTECDFQLSKQSMNASSGVIGISQEDRETEECPNDGTMMVPVTYREQLAAYESRLFQELDAADGQRKEIAKLKSDHEAALRQRDERIAALEAENAELVRKHNEQFKAAAQLAEGVVKLNAENARLSACEWRPITPDDLPKVGDEALNVTRWVMPVTIESQKWNAETWARNRWTHFRAINPPQQGKP